MPANLTKTGIRIDELRFWRQEALEESGLVTRWYASADYYVETAEGETWRRSINQEITGPIEAKAADLLADIRAYILGKEGL